jgi:DNA polymerase (family 10)
MATQSRDIAGRLAGIIGQGGRGAALARELAREGVRTRADLRRPAVLARLPREAQANVLFSPARAVPLARALATAAEVVRRLVFDGRLEVIPVGSIRRRAALVGDLDFLVVVATPAGASTALASATLRRRRAGDVLEVADTYAAGARRRSLILRADGGAGARPLHYRCDLFMTTAAEKPYALYHFTGPKAYNIRIRSHAKRQGKLLNQYGLFDAATRHPLGQRIRSERELAHALGVTYYPPEERRGD